MIFIGEILGAILSSEVFIHFVKAAIVMGALLQFAALTTWVERKASALIQDRIGANRASILGFDLAGIFNTLVADPVKALFKEDFVPKGTSQIMHCLAIFLSVFPVIVSFAVVPFGPPLLVGEREISLQLANLNVGLLYVFAMGSLAVYGVVIAGWVSNNKFSLFGGLRATAQMISYEVTMGVSIIGLLAIYQSLDLNEIVQAQDGTIFGFLPRWGIFLNPVAFFIFFASMMAETKRAPFDLPESESELVAGYMTEYSGMKFLLFWLGEFAEIVVASAIVVIIFFGGWQLPYVEIDQITPSVLTEGNWLWSLVWGVLGAFGLQSRDLSFQWGPLLGPMIFGAKVAFFCVLQVVIRWTLPRFRYDQLMNLCWKILFPISLLNLVVTVLFLLLMK